MTTSEPFVPRYRVATSGLPALAVVSCLLACNGMAPPVDGDETQEARLTFGASRIGLRVGEQLQLLPSLSGGSGFSLAAVSYTSSNAAVLTVSSGGLIDAVAPGAAMVRATAKVLPGGTSSSAELQVDVTAQTPRIELSNLPSSMTPATSASIQHQVVNAAGGETVYCRLDSYAPVVCPNPFRLGATSPLATGSHSVDYYLVAAGETLQTTPSISYAWTIVAPGGGASTGLPALALPAPTAISGYSGTWGGATTISGAEGAVRLGPVADPAGTGRTVNLHRIVRNDPLISGGQRAELLFHDRESTKLYPAHDYWLAFAVMRKPQEAQFSSTPFGMTNYSDTYDELLVMQTHTPQPGATQPDIALFFNSQGAYAGWRVAYNSSGTVDGNGWMSTEGNPWVHKEALPAPGEWVRYVVHYRPGYSTAQQPRLRVWRARPGQVFEQIVEHTGFNTYNTSLTGTGPSYPRIGPYGGYGGWRLSSYAFYMTPLYFGEGADLLEPAKAALTGL